MRQDGPDHTLGASDAETQSSVAPKLMGGDTHDDPSGDDAFEVTSLRPATDAPESGAARWLRALRLLRPITARVSARGWRLAAVAGALVVTLAIILGMIPGVTQRLASISARSTPRPQAAPNSSGFLTLTLGQGPSGPTPTPNPTAQGAAPGPAPTSCPGGVTTVTAAAPFAGTLGAGPVWFGSFVGPRATISLAPSHATANPYGIPVQVVLFISSNTRGPISIDGVDLAEGHPLWFSFTSIGNGAAPPDQSSAQSFATTYAFTPQRQAPGVDSFWYASYGALYLPGAGCYALHAQWPGGGWQVTFVAGGVSAGR